MIYFNKRYCYHFDDVHLSLVHRNSSYHNTSNYTAYKISNSIKKPCNFYSFSISYFSEPECVKLWSEYYYDFHKMLRYLFKNIEITIDYYHKLEKHVFNYFI